VRPYNVWVVAFSPCFYFMGIRIDARPSWREYFSAMERILFQLVSFPGGGNRLWRAVDTFPAAPLQDRNCLAMRNGYWKRITPLQIVTCTFPSRKAQASLPTNPRPAWQPILSRNICWDKSSVSSSERGLPAQCSIQEQGR